MKKRIYDWCKAYIHLNFKQLLVIISLTLALVFIGIVSLQSYHSTLNYILSSIENTHSDSLIQSAQKLENELFHIQSIVRYLSTDPVLAEKLLLYDHDDNIVQKIKLKGEITGLLARMKPFNPHIENLALFINDKSFYSDFQIPFYKTTPQDHMIRLPLDQVFTPNHFAQALLFEEFKRYPSSHLTLHNDIQDGGIFALINPQIFESIFSSDSNYLVLKENDELIWKGISVTKDELDLVKYLPSSYWRTNTQYAQSKGLTFYQTALSFNGWKICYIQRFSEINQKIRILNGFTVVSFLISILLAIVLSQLISKKIADPVRQLTHSITQWDLKSSKIPFEYHARKLKITMRESILYYLIGVIFIPVCIYAGISYFFSRDIITNYIIESNFKTFKQTAGNIDSYISSKEKVIKGIVYSDTIQKFVDDQYSSAKSISHIKPSIQEAEGVVDRMIRLSHGKDEVFLYDKNRMMLFTNTYYTRDPGMDQVLSQEFIEGATTLQWQNTQIDSYHRPMLHVTQKVKHLQDYHTIGYLHCTFPEYSLENIYKSSISEGNNLFIINSDKQVISHPDKNKIGTLVDMNILPNVTKEINKKENTIYFKLPLNNSHWYLVGKFPMGIFQKDWQALLYEKIYILVLIFFITALVAFILSYYLTSTLGKINQMLKNVSIDNMEMAFPENNFIHEVNDLGTTFNEMVTKMYSLIDQLILSTKKQHDLENKKKEAELIALQAQINPHFLYNTFDSINWLIKTQNPNQAIQMINALSDLLRYTAKSNQPIVSFMDEIGYVKHYAQIMQMRFGDGLEFSWDIDSSLVNHKTISLILQPLVENAIYHGIQPNNSKGHIRISCNNHGKHIILSVSDNGVGIEPTKLKILNQNLQDETFYDRIGLHNVQNRIRLFYGSEYGITLFSQLDKGTTARIRIPCFQ